MKGRSVMQKVGLFIDNMEIFTNNVIEVKDPGCLSDVVGTVAQGTYEHVDQAVISADRTFKSWRNTAVKERISLLEEVAHKLEEETKPLAALISKENGMLVATTEAEIGLAVSCIRNTCELAKTFFIPKEVEDETGWVHVEKKPMGVIAGIVPWNAPIVLTVQKMAPAVVSGNTIVIKPSPNAAIGVTACLKVISELLPPGVINVVHGDGEVGEALTSHPLVRKISFTGGGQTAKYVMKAAADSLKEVHFELGGNDPAIVLDDADLDEIMPKIVGGVFRRSGQFCFAIKRVYVHESLYDRFFEKMCEVTDQFKIGHQMNKDATFGPLNNKQQFEKVKAILEKVEASPAKVVKLGQKLDKDEWNNGYYLQPTIVRDLKPDDEIVTCEQFGPVIPLISYQSIEEVIELANNTEYGLGSSIWSSNAERALEVAKKIEAGLTFINGSGQTPLGYKEIPFGGVKQSGIGRENSEVVFGEYVEYHGINLHKSLVRSGGGLENG